MKLRRLHVLFASTLFLQFSIPAGAVAQAAANPLREHVPGSGFRIAEADWGTLNFSVFTYVRYLNQLGLDETYTDSFGRTTVLDLRNDLQLQKAVLYFKGWLGTEDFRYLFYVWTSNTSLGLGAQVVVAGNLSYQGERASRVGRGDWRPAGHPKRQGAVALLAQARQPHHGR